MGTIKEILANKGSSQVHTTSETATVLEATHYMNQHKIGAVVVTREDALAGIFTERDVLRRVVAAGRPPQDVKVGEVMTREVIYCRPSTAIDEVSRIMKDQRVRHVPVLDDDGKLLGLISIGDVNAYHASDQEATIHYLHEYISGNA